jgi:hypothetical protein
MINVIKRDKDFVMAGPPHLAEGVPILMEWKAIM